MLQVELTFLKPIAKIDKDGSAIVAYDKDTQTHIVASTKSYNKLLEGFKEENKILGKSLIKELFIDKKAAEETIHAFVLTQIEDEKTAKTITSHMIKALDGACVFKRPPVIRSKQ